MKLKELLLSLPSTVQYIAIIGLVMLILYVALTLTRILGSKFGEKVDYNDPEKADQIVPDLFGSTAFKRKKKKAKDVPQEEKNPDSE